MHNYICLSHTDTIILKSNCMNTGNEVYILPSNIVLISARAVYSAVHMLRNLWVNPSWRYVLWTFHETSHFTPHYWDCLPGTCPLPLLQERICLQIHSSHPRSSGTAFWNRCMPSASYRAHLYLSKCSGWRQ